jgi:hypothetical protein
MEKIRLKFCENRVLTKIFGPKDEVTGYWRELYSAELFDHCFLPIVIRLITSRVRYGLRTWQIWGKER